MLISRLFQFFFKPLQLFIEVVVAIDAEVIADAAAVGGDGLVVGDAVELEQLCRRVKSALVTQTVSSLDNHSATYCL